MFYYKVYQSNICGIACSLEYYILILYS